MLIAELKREGFHVVPLDKADYLFACAAEGSDPTLSPATASSAVVFHNRGIRLCLYSNPQTHPGRLNLAWQGYIAAGPNTSAEGEMALIRTLLGYFGRDQHGPVNL